jgi:hypothetical protein
MGHPHTLFVPVVGKLNRACDGNAAVYPACGGFTFCAVVGLKAFSDNTLDQDERERRSQMETITKSIRDSQIWSRFLNAPMITAFEVFSFFAVIALLVK